MTRTAQRCRAFDGITVDAKPCPICLELAAKGRIQPRAVMPLPPFPARSLNNRQCCRDCERQCDGLDR